MWRCLMSVSMFWNGPDLQNRLTRAAITTETPLTRSCERLPNSDDPQAWRHGSVRLNQCSVGLPR